MSARVMLVDKYRRHAVDCLRIAEGVPSPQSRMILIDMAQSWLLLAQQAETRVATDPVYERLPPLPYEVDRPGAQAQQQQQIQPKKTEDKKTEDKKTEDKKTEDKKTEDKKTEE